MNPTICQACGERIETPDGRTVCAECLLEIMAEVESWQPEEFNPRIREPEAKPVEVPRHLLRDLLEDAIDLKGERDWCKDEIRCGHAEAYKALDARICTVENLLKESEAKP